MKPFHFYAKRAKYKAMTTNVQIAKIIGKSPVQIGIWMRADDVKVSVAMKIADACGMTLCDFFADE